MLNKQLKSYSGIQSLFNAAAQQFDDANIFSNGVSDSSFNFGIRCTLEDFKLCGEPVLEVEFKGEACLISRQIMAPIVLAYGAPNDQFESRDAVIERFELGETSIIHGKNKVSILLDVSTLAMPPFCQFRFAKISAQDEIDIEAFELLGIEKLWVPGGLMDVIIT